MVKKEINVIYRSPKKEEFVDKAIRIIAKDIIVFIQTLSHPEKNSEEGLEKRKKFIENLYKKLKCFLLQKRDKVVVDKTTMSFLFGEKISNLFCENISYTVEYGTTNLLIKEII